MTDDKSRATPIYASFLTFQTLLDWLRETKHVPSQFDRSWWGSKFNGTTGAQLMAGLRFLGLLNGDEPDDQLQVLAFASNEERPALLAALIRNAYGADLVDSLPRTTPKALSDRIAQLGTTDATHRKAIAFFVNFAKAAQLPMPTLIAKQARNRPVTNAKAKSRAPKVDASKGTDEEAKKDLEQKPEPQNVAGIPKPVLEVVRLLPAKEWTARARAKWLAAITATVDVIIDVTDEQEAI